ncbi:MULTISPECIES: acyl carrier protein [Rhodanobacter]|uniref:Acyl carrier protein n=1 Tax=Rhodanobacter hydrolyticus TaxID=2250595 RepID=A0ABW8J8E6_9GAMM|nr:acyl carrier protein [Rhodanobacter sp. 7MK24]MBD8881900.1 acyl carrier protein [Rhodanobacter sp. 7MK24]
MKSILDILSGIRPEFDFSASQDYLADGMLDSFDMLALVSDLDSEFGIRIEGTQIVPENFCNLQAIRLLLGRYGVDA